MKNKLSINRLHHYFKPKCYAAQLLLSGMGEGAYQECSYSLQDSNFNLETKVIIKYTC